LLGGGAMKVNFQMLASLPKTFLRFFSFKLKQKEFLALLVF